MRRGRLLLPVLTLVIAVGAVLAPVEAQGPTPKRGGIVTSVIIEDPPGFSIHESATVSTVWPMHHSLYNWGRMQDVWVDK